MDTSGLLHCNIVLLPAPWGQGLHTKVDKSYSIHLEADGTECPSFHIVSSEYKNRTRPERSCRIHCCYICVTSLERCLTPLCVEIVSLSVFVFGCCFSVSSCFSFLLSALVFSSSSLHTKINTKGWCSAVFSFQLPHFAHPQTGINSAKMP